jgi:hypothetical protein
LTDADPGRIKYTQRITRTQSRPAGGHAKVRPSSVDTVQSGGARSSAASARQGLTCRRPAAERCATAARAARRSSARGAPSAAGPRTPRRGSPRGGLAFSSRRGVRPGSSRVHLRTRAVACRMRSTNNEPEGRAACTHGAARACQAAGSEVGALCSRMHARGGVAQGSASAPERHETGRPAHCSRRAAYGGRGGARRTAWAGHTCS